MAAIPFVPRIDDAPYATSQQLSPLVRRVIAENPSKFTYRGTGTYIIGTHDVVVIDPGPRLDSHRDALQRALDGCNVVGIVVTHCHADHSPLSQWLKESTGAPTFALGPHADVVFDADDVEEDDEEDGGAVERIELFAEALDGSATSPRAARIGAVGVPAATTSGTGMTAATRSSRSRQTGANAASTFATSRA